MNPYELLNIYVTAGDNAIKQAWMTKMREAHPDKGGSHAAAVELNMAYELIATSEARRKRRMNFETEGKRECGECGGAGYAYQSRRAKAQAAPKVTCSCCHGEGMR